MKMPYQYDNGELYDKLIAEIPAIQSVAVAAKGKMPAHLNNRLLASVNRMQKTAEKFKPDPDHPDLESEINRLEDVVEMEDYPRSHISLDADWPGTWDESEAAK